MNNILQLVVYAIALVFPPMFAFSMTPSPTLLNQLLAVGGWGLCLAVHRATPAEGGSRRAIGELAVALAVMIGAVVFSWALGSLPTSLALPPIGLLVAAIAIAVLAARIARNAGADDIDAFTPFAVGMVIVGLLSAGVAAAQVFRPDMPDGNFIARSGLPGRAVGNLRQPNHLASLLVWSVIALVPLVEWRRIPRWLGTLLAAMLTLGVILSGSRTGQYGGLAVLVLWGAFDFRLSRASRLSLSLGLPVVGVALWLGVAAYLGAQHQVFGAQARLSEGDSSHFAIWRNAVEMIRQQPWTGVGWGEFNFAWTLTPFPDRPVAFFDHTHNLPLQLVAEMGVPAGLLVIGLLLAALVKGAMRAWSETGLAGHGARAAWVMVLLIAVHSLDEYPLWYAYFLLPAAWAWGFALGSGGASRSAQPAAAPAAAGDGAFLRCAGVVMLAIAAAAAWDYSRVSTIFAEDDDPPLVTRIANGQRSLLFAHHADYAEATTTEPPARALPAIDRAAHSLIDTRLMIVWARALDESGQVDEARYLVARLREFRKDKEEDAAEFFAPCSDPAVKDKPFQCQPPTRALTWRDFR